MSLLKKTFGFIAIMGVLPAASALTSRLGYVGNASTRMPTMTTYITNPTATVATTSALLANAECIDAYTSCMKGADACGPDFEECTTKVLFHGKMPQCISTLAQCNTAGITSLFGIGTTTSLGAVATKNSYGEITDYTYPTDGSVLGQMISGAAISNRLDTSSCIKKYTSCLKRSTNCGNDFELCTTNQEFKRQMVNCASTLALCDSEGKIELFGSVNTTTTPAASSRIGEMISEGAALAAINSVSTCYKVVDQCILTACAENPYKCMENSSQATVDLAQTIASGTEGTGTEIITDTITNSAIAGYIRNSCRDVIGANKYCYATFVGNGAMPTAAQLRDEDNQDEVFDEAYGARMNSAMKAKISELVDKFDTKAKEKCTETIRECAMRVCGGGSGAACYSQVYGNKDKSINNSVSWNEIKTGCAAIVNTDANCKYAAANPNASGPYSYAYINNDAFDTLFPEYEEGGMDPIGVVAALNANLANSYSDAAIAQMKRQCQAVATSCVKSMCGNDYMNCYRNRTDIYSNLTDTGNMSFDKSMNKVGGVLDYTIVLGLCLDTVKNAAVCEEHLAIEQNKLKLANAASSASSWGDAGSVRTGWIDAGKATTVAAETEQVAAVDENGNQLCSAKDGSQGVCYSVDANGNIYDQPVYISYTTYIQSQAASSLFKDLIYDLEKEAQAKYNAKLTKEQNMCMSANSGGVMGKKDMGSTYMWAKLKSQKVPANYSVNGLKPNQFVASNDLYGSFCRIRITLQSDDKRIQEAIRNGSDWSTAYFAVGDTFTCGSWIPSSALEEIANAVADKATEGQEASQKRTRTWLTTLGALGGTVGGAYLGSGIQNGTVFGGLTGLGDGGKKNNNAKSAVQNCIDYAEQAPKESDFEQMRTYANAAIERAKAAGVSVSSSVNDAVNNLSKISAGDNDNTEYDIGGAKKKKSDLVSAAKTAMGTLKTACELKKDDSGEPKKGNNNAWVGSTIGAVTTGLAGGFLVNKITKDIQDSNLDSAQKAAYEEWMNNVGKHIQCYIGGDEAGEYGDIITTSIE